jgi:hypothetical protein
MSRLGFSDASLSSQTCRGEDCLGLTPVTMINLQSEEYSERALCPVLPSRLKPWPNAGSYIENSDSDATGHYEAVPAK